MFTADQYRAKAIEYSKLANIASGRSDVFELQRLERSFSELADNAQWVTDNSDKTVPPADERQIERGSPNSGGSEKIASK